jgi:exosome complex component RRP40
MEVDQRIVLPGDVIDVNSESTIVLGPGLRQEGDDVVATKAGILHNLEVGNRYWIESNQKRVNSDIKETHEKVLITLIVYCSNWRVSYWYGYCKNE